MVKLKKNSLLFLQICYSIWKTVKYYSNMFGIDAGECTMDVPVKIMEYQNKTFIRFEFDKCEKAEYTTLDMIQMMQEYLNICILYKQNVVRPYAGSESEWDLIEALYIYQLIEFDTYYWLDVLWIDNEDSYTFCKEVIAFREKIKWLTGEEDIYG